MVAAAVAFVCLAPELAFVCAAPPDVAAADPPADADVIVEPVPVCEEGAWVFEACEVGGVVAVALLSDVAAKKTTNEIHQQSILSISNRTTLHDDEPCLLIIRPPRFSMLGGHGHAAVKVAI